MRHAGYNGAHSWQSHRELSSVPTKFSRRWAPAVWVRFYRARDTRLDRTVAIKVLNSQLVANAELRARFEREAKIISQLQHSHICVLYDIGHQDGTDFLRC